MSDWVLVRGTVYKRNWMRRGYEYLRMSVPPDAKPGKRATMPVRYAEHKLPEHEVIDEQRAKEIQRDSVARWTERLRAAAGEPS